MITNRMNARATKRRLLGAVAVSAIALVATQAHAQQVIGNLPVTGVTVTPNGGNECAAGQIGGYTTTNGTTNLGDVTVSDPDVAQTLCGNFDADVDYSVSNSGATTFYGEPANFVEFGNAQASYEFVLEATDVSDTSTLPATYLYSSTAVAPLTPTAASNYGYVESTQTDQQVLANAGEFAIGTGSSGYGSSWFNLTYAGGAYWTNSFGSSSFDPDTGEVIYTPEVAYTQSQSALGNSLWFENYDTGTILTTQETAFSVLNAYIDTNTGIVRTGEFAWDGLTLEDSDTGKTTFYGIDGVFSNGPVSMSSGTSYVAVNPDSVVLHGGTSSTTVTIDDNGLTVADSTNGTTFSVDNTGAVSIFNGLTMNGTVISNVGNGVAATDAVNLGQMQAGDAATLTSANTYTNTQVAAEAALRVAGDAATLTSANTYTNTQVAAEAALRSAADVALGNRITAETSARIAADTLLSRQIQSSTATAIALGGQAILPDYGFTLSANVGFYEGAQAVAVNAAAKVSEGLYITGAVGGGLNKDGNLGGRVGMTIGF